MSAVEFVIVGQGLAGTTLAWHLLRRGRTVLVVERESGNSASRLAAGLITPVTGKRLAKSWRWDDLFPAAVAFYREIETQTGTRFFDQQPAIRLFADERERAEFHRRATTVLHGLVEARADVNPAWFAAPLGGFTMPVAARLDVPRYLDASRAYFRSRGAYTTGHIDPHDPGWPLTTIVFCRGFNPIADRWFGTIPFHAAKGEMLTVRIPELAENRVIHCRTWLAPLGETLFRTGSTYTWEPLNAQPTPEGRAEVESNLRAFLKLPYEVIDHQAAVRPVIDAGFPVLGSHPHCPRLAFFNGLGSKGALLAPFFANQLAAYLCNEGHIDDAVNVRKYLCHD